MESLLWQVADLDTWRASLLSVLLAYVLTQTIASVYVWTYRGLSYSRAMAQTLVVSGVVSAMLMMAIGNSLARGIGIVGTLALIRFRTNLRDPLDMIFVFAAFGAGIASGTQSFATAVIGTVVFLGVATMMRTSDFGAQRQFDGVLRLTLPADGEADAALQRVLGSICRSFALVTLREAAQGEAQELAYQITLRRDRDEGRLLREVAALPGASAVNVAMQEATVEM